ncbi:hypothetical protein OAP07_05655 [Bacteroidia bacterium]|nr:hypothetical protein [Bacteroidia bacterium]MDC0561543.1 hypothetical protein [Bacteroidia bacterium]
MKRRVPLSLVLFSCILWANINAYSQTKKQRISSLTNQVDSLFKIVFQERQDYALVQTKMEEELNSLSNQLDSVFYDFKLMSIKNDFLTQSNTQKLHTIDSLSERIEALSSQLNRKKRLDDFFPIDQWLGQKLIIQAKISQVIAGDSTIVSFELLDIQKNSGPTLAIGKQNWKLNGTFEHMNLIEALSLGDFYQLTFQYMKYDVSATQSGEDWMLIEMTKENSSGLP